MNVVFRPIVLWPGQLTPDRQRRDTPFQARIDETWRLLEKEAGHVGGRELVVQLALDEGQLRLDGRPRAGAQPVHPGVIVSFDSRYGPLQYSTDVFTHWHANLRAIALGLEALRKVDRYGISKRGEQYTGWKALPSANGQTYAKRGAAKLILELAGLLAVDENVSGILAGQSFYRSTYRLAARKAHPDLGGSPETFAALEDARRLLEGIPR